jgi:hypothetical protein
MNQNQDDAQKLIVEVEKTLKSKDVFPQMPIL